MNTVKIHPYWYICITIRLFLSAIPLLYRDFIKQKGDKYAIIIKCLLLLIGLGFGWKAFFGTNNEKQIACVFWHKTRFIHSFLFIGAALNFHNYYLSSFLLITSVVFSICYRFVEGHFRSI
mgnify:CR=1 FL=1